jgi:DNA-binding NarL/FixJ family response regulator
MKHILLADDHNIVLDGLTSLLSTVPEWQVDGRCVNGAEVLDSVSRQSPDLLLMDVGMPVMDGIEVVRRLTSTDSLPLTILLAASLADAQIREAVSLGVWGIVMKEQASGTIVDCAHAALDGEPWVPGLRMQRALGRAAGGETTPVVDAALTHRESEIAQAVVNGLSNKAIAGRLQIAEGTVKTHLHRIYKKAGVRNRVQLVLHSRSA